MTANNPFAANPSTTKASTLLGVEAFSQLYSAAEFAVHQGLPLDTSVTITWSRLGCETPQDVQAGFTTFLKCLRAWFDQHSLPAVWTYVHEAGPIVGLHTHMSVGLPSPPPAHLALKNWRREFRDWIRGWGPRQVGRPTPRAIRVGGPARATEWIHWRLFCYALKGYDRSAIVLSARKAPDGRVVMLGDLIASTWADPGHIPLERRFGASKLLGPAQRAQGRIDIGPPAARPWLDFDFSSPMRGKGRCARLPYDWRPPAEPFRSKFQDGVRDVRALYGHEFVERMIGVPVARATPAADVLSGPPQAHEVRSIRD